MLPNENDDALENDAADAEGVDDAALSNEADGAAADAGAVDSSDDAAATAVDESAAADEPVASTPEAPASEGAPDTDEPDTNEPDTNEMNETTSEEEARIRQELGVGNAKIEVNQQVIDDLLQGAVVGYERIFDDTVLGGGGRGARDFGIGLPGDADATPVQENLSLLRDVHMNVKVELGRGHMYLKDILRLGQGSVVELERLAGDPLDIYVNDKVIARGEVLVLNENFCIRITEIFNPADVLKE